MMKSQLLRNNGLRLSGSSNIMRILVLIPFLSPDLLIFFSLPHNKGYIISAIAIFSHIHAMSCPSSDSPPKACQRSTHRRCSHWSTSKLLLHGRLLKTPDKICLKSSVASRTTLYWCSFHPWMSSEALWYPIVGWCPEKFDGQYGDGQNGSKPKDVQIGPTTMDILILRLCVYLMHVTTENCNSL